MTEANGTDATRLVARAREGDRTALEALVATVQDRVYNLAIRMLWHPADAEDATQEILLRIITHLATFRGESAFTTWIYRIAANYLLTTRKRRAEQEELTFTGFGKDIETGIVAAIPAPATEVDDHLLTEEVKLGCTKGMLLCLDRDHRLAYILGEVFELTGEEAAVILEITPAAFRKRLSRARGRIREFVEATCGIVNPANPCRCARRIGYAIQNGRVDPSLLRFATHPIVTRDDAVDEAVYEMEDLHSAAALFRSHPRYAAPERARAAIREMLQRPGSALLTS
jgi:RNA polymerase sigma factor (sigma-70 family)